tara:strand:- start:248 stop:442 length:195 start_codon:yes stop_codon:yes gene_type:complete
LGDGSWEMGACGLPVPNEVGSLRLEVRSERLEVGRWKLEACPYRTKFGWAGGWGVAGWKIGVME